MVNDSDEGWPDWRDHADRGEWSLIDPYLVPKKDRVELAARLERIVPKRIRQDGLERAEDWCRHGEVDDPELKYAAWILDQLHALLSSDDDREPQGRDEAEHLAVQILAEHGIEWRGWSKTVVGPAAEPLDELWASDGFLDRTYSRLWHAIRILALKQDLAMERTAARLEPDRPLEQDEIEAIILNVANISIEIGRSFQQIQNKPFERHAIRGKKVAEGGAEGGRLRSENFETTREAVLDFMTSRVGKLGVSAAAKLAHKKGLGTSADANRQLWYSYRDKKL